jgi:hypothetical protein
MWHQLREGHFSRAGPTSALPRGGAGSGSRYGVAESEMLTHGVGLQRVHPTSG